MNSLNLAADLARRFEGLRLAPYLCPAGIPTIGYGSTEYADGRRVTLDDTPLTAAQADMLLLVGLARVQEQVIRMLPALENSPPRLAAVVDFSWNVGLGALHLSTLARKIKAGQWDDAAAQFSRWTTASGKVLPGLVARREAERELFLQGDAG